jgi:hypothetical protein
VSRLDPEIAAAFLRCIEAGRECRYSSLDDYQPPRDLKPLATERPDIRAFVTSEPEPEAGP